MAVDARELGFDRRKHLGLVLDVPERMAPDGHAGGIVNPADRLLDRRVRARAAGAKVQFIHSQAHDVAQWGSPLSPNKIVASLALLDTPRAEMALLGHMWSRTQSSAAMGSWNHSA